MPPAKPHAVAGPASGVEQQSAFGWRCPDHAAQLRSGVGRNFPVFEPEGGPMTLVQFQKGTDDLRRELWRVDQVIFALETDGWFAQTRANPENTTAAYRRRTSETGDAPSVAGVVP